MLPAHAVTMVGLMLHELATNAVKHGALAADHGRVDLTWRIEEGGPRPDLLVEWRESGGPQIDNPPAAGGFGNQMLSRLAEQFRAELHLDWRREGLAVSLRLRLAAENAADSDRAPAPALL